MGLWGVAAVIIGLILGFVGVVPIGMLASIFHGEWAALILLVVGTFVTYLTRFFALWRAAKVYAAEYERQHRVIEGTVVR
jgi:hypothetical protein